MEHVDLCLTRYEDDNNIRVADVYTNHFNPCFGGYNTGAYDLFPSVELPLKIKTGMKALRYCIAHRSSDI